MTEQLHLVQEWDKVFPKSDKVDHKKVTFHNHFGITLVADMYTPKNTSGKLPALAVSGPFGAVKEQSSGLYAQEMAERGFLTIAFDPSYTGESDKLDSAIYTLSNPEKMDDFVKEVKSEIDTDSYSVTSSDEIYEQMLSPLNNISSIAQNIVILVAVAGAVILTLIVILSIRERRYEIGVLMSLGENRLKIIGQFFTELFMVTVVSLVIATVAGNFVGNALGNQLLSSSTQAQQTTKNDFPGGPGQETNSSNDDNKQNDSKPQNDKPSGGGFGNMMTMATSSSKEIDQLDIKLTGNDVAKLGGIALLISFVSTILASIGIIRMKPKDILSSN
jgi:putative ABC transport system permease protein